MNAAQDEAVGKLEAARNIWIATVRQDGRPHLAPVWFVYIGGRIYFSTEGSSVKARNIAWNEQVALALEEGDHPVICEGNAYPIRPPVPEMVAQAFLKKYEWDLSTETQYTQLFEVIPDKWMAW
jgi:hypothetical protein